MIQIDCEECIWATRAKCLPRLASRYPIDIEIDREVFYLECRVCDNDIPIEMTEEMIIDYKGRLE